MTMEAATKLEAGKASGGVLRPDATRIRNTPTAYTKSLAGLQQRVGKTFIEHSPRVLDFGCGFGRGTAVLEGKFPDVSAYDPYPVEEWKLASPLYHDIESLRKGEKFDIVFAIYVLNVLPPRDRKTAVRDILSLLDEGGVAVFAVRSWHGDVAKTKTGVRAEEPKALYVPRGEAYTYQRGYNGVDLLNELDWYTEDRDYITVGLPTWGPPLAALARKGVI